MPDPKLFKTDPRSYALAMVEDEGLSRIYLLTACLKYMSCDDVRDMLDANELSPRFRDDEEQEG